MSVLGDRTRPPRADPPAGEQPRLVWRASKRRRALWWATAPALGCAVALHFTILLFYNLPPNPISNALLPAINAYVVPLWVQSWWLFAPGPGSSNHVVYVRGIHVDGGRSETTDWINLNGPLIEAVQANRL